MTFPCEARMRWNLSPAATLILCHLRILSSPSGCRSRNGPTLIQEPVQTERERYSIAIMLIKIDVACERLVIGERSNSGCCTKTYLVIGPNRVYKEINISAS